MPLLQLDSEQAAALQAIKLQRDVALLSATLAAAFPDVASRLGERYDALIALGVQRGAAQGLDHAVCVARYLACWFMLGAAFETRPECGWARDMLAAPRPQGSRVFQLCRRTREELVRLSGAAAGGDAAATTGSPAAFDLAVAALDAALIPRGALGSLLPPEPVQLGEACDLDAVDLRLVEPATGRQHHLYRLEDATRQWRRLPAGAARAALTLAAGSATTAHQPAPALPPRLNFLSQAADREYARLRVRTRTSHCCDPQVHPLITLNDSQGLAQWRGAHAADVVLGLYAAPPDQAADDGPRPVIGHETSAQLSQLTLASCGLRETGQPLGEQQTQLAVYPAEQHWMVWRRESSPPLEWPEAGAATQLARPALYRVERDGLALDASRWQAGLEDLDRQLAESLSRLATAWERESGVARGRMQCEPAVMSGSATITWGWAEAGANLADLPWYRLAGALDLVACQLHLRLSGDLALQGSTSRLVLDCSGRSELKCVFERRPADTDMAAVVASAQIAFRHPFVLAIDPLAPADNVALLDAAGPVAGALVGACGLRQRKAGAGLEWFCELAIEPVSVPLRISDPLLGQVAWLKPLLPAQKLLDWSLG